MTHEQLDALVEYVRAQAHATSYLATHDGFNIANANRRDKAEQRLRELFLKPTEGEK